MLELSNNPVALLLTTHDIEGISIKHTKKEKHARINDYLVRIISEVENVQKQDLGISAHISGKPYISLPSSSLKFNLSHSGDSVAIAFARKREVGIDIECLTRDRDFLEIAKTHYPENEYIYLSSLKSLTKLKQAFYFLWTIKESFCKASQTPLIEALAIDFSSNINGRKFTKRVGGHLYNFSTNQWDGCVASVCC